MQVKIFLVVFPRSSTKFSKCRDVTKCCCLSWITITMTSNKPVNSPHKGPVTRKKFPFDDAITLSAQKKRVRNHKWLEKNPENNIMSMSVASTLPVSGVNTFADAVTTKFRLIFTGRGCFQNTYDVLNASAVEIAAFYKKKSYRSMYRHNVLYGISKFTFEIPH